MAARPTVQHWIACHEVRAVPPVAVNNFYDLLWVGPVHLLAADLEFPSSYAQIDLFARFFDGRGRWGFEVEVIWVDGPGGARLLDIYGPFVVHFRPGEPMRDYNFRLNNVALPGVGRYRNKLWLLGRRHRKLLATEYLEVRLQQP